MSTESYDELIERRFGGYRAGRFYVDPRLLLTLSAEDFAVIFGGILITRAEHTLTRKRLYYEGLSQMFDAVEEGYEVPWYELVISSGDDGKVSEVKAVKMDRERTILAGLP